MAVDPHLDPTGGERLVRLDGGPKPAVEVSGGGEPRNPDPGTGRVLQWWVKGAVRLGRGTALFVLPPIEPPRVDDLVLIAKHLKSPLNCRVDGERDVRCCHQDRVWC